MNGLVQLIMVEDSTRYKWVNTCGGGVSFYTDYVTNTHDDV